MPNNGSSSEYLKHTGSTTVNATTPVFTRDETNVTAPFIGNGPRYIDRDPMTLSPDGFVASITIQSGFTIISAATAPYEPGILTDTTGFYFKLPAVPEDESLRVYIGLCETLDQYGDGDSYEMELAHYSGQGGDIWEVEDNDLESIDLEPLPDEVFCMVADHSTGNVSLLRSSEPDVVIATIGYGTIERRPALFQIKAYSNSSGYDGITFEIVPDPVVVHTAYPPPTMVVEDLTFPGTSPSTDEFLEIVEVEGLLAPIMIEQFGELDNGDIVIMREPLGLSVTTQLTPQPAVNMDDVNAINLATIDGVDVMARDRDTTNVFGTYSSLPSLVHYGTPEVANTRGIDHDGVTHVSPTSIDLRDNPTILEWTNRIATKVKLEDSVNVQGGIFNLPVNSTTTQEYSIFIGFTSSVKNPVLILEQFLGNDAPIQSPDVIGISINYVPGLGYDLTDVSVHYRKGGKSAGAVTTIQLAGPGGVTHVTTAEPIYIGHRADNELTIGLVSVNNFNVVTMTGTFDVDWEYRPMRAIAMFVKPPVSDLPAGTTITNVIVRDHTSVPDHALAGHDYFITDRRYLRNYMSMGGDSRLARSNIVLTEPVLVAKYSYDGWRFSGIVEDGCYAQFDFDGDYTGIIGTRYWFEDEL